jgi:hypothetical protein
VIRGPVGVISVATVLHEVVAVYGDGVPLLKIGWVKHAKTWAESKTLTK